MTDDDSAFDEEDATTEEETETDEEDAVTDEEISLPHRSSGVAMSKLVQEKRERSEKRVQNAKCKVQSGELQHGMLFAESRAEPERRAESATTSAPGGTRPVPGTARSASQNPCRTALPSDRIDRNTRVQDVILSKKEAPLRGETRAESFQSILAIKFFILFSPYSAQNHKIAAAASEATAHP